MISFFSIAIKRPLRPELNRFDLKEEISIICN